MVAGVEILLAIGHNVTHFVSTCTLLLAHDGKTGKFHSVRGPLQCNAADDPWEKKLKGFVQDGFCYRFVPSTQPRLRSVHLVRLCLNRLPAVADTLQNLLPILVELELGDLALGRRDADRYCLAVGLFARDALDVDDIFETVDGGDLALAALVRSSSDDDLVVLADRDGADLYV